VHDPVAPHLVLADHRYVVFGLASHDARGATGAGIHIDGHAPGVLAGEPCLPERGKGVRRLSAIFLVKLLERGFENDRPALHGEMTLGGDHVFAAAGFFQANAGGRKLPYPIGDEGQRIDIRPNLFSNLAGSRSAVSYRCRNGSSFLSRLDEDRKLERAAIRGKPNHISFS
jgi:hypothetical protein